LPDSIIRWGQQFRKGSGNGRIDRVRGTLGSFAEANDPKGHYRDIRRRLLDVHDMRLSAMDRHGIELFKLDLA
jgi:hypothetical protein